MQLVGVIYLFKKPSGAGGFVVLALLVGAWMWGTMQWNALGHHYSVEENIPVSASWSGGTQADVRLVNRSEAFLTGADAECSFYFKNGAFSETVRRSISVRGFIWPGATIDRPVITSPVKKEDDLDPSLTKCRIVKADFLAAPDTLPQIQWGTIEGDTVFRVTNNTDRTLKSIQFSCLDKDGDFQKASLEPRYGHGPGYEIKAGETFDLVDEGPWTFVKCRPYSVQWS